MAKTGLTGFEPQVNMLTENSLLDVGARIPQILADNARLSQNSSSFRCYSETRSASVKLPGEIGNVLPPPAPLSYISASINQVRMQVHLDHYEDQLNTICCWLVAGAT